MEDVPQKRERIMAKKENAKQKSKAWNLDIHIRHTLKPRQSLELRKHVQRAKCRSSPAVAGLHGRMCT